MTVLVTSRAAAEVMDKEPGLPEIWAAAFVGALVAGAAAYIRPLWGVIALPFACVVPWGNTTEFDGSIGRAILEEAGQGYVNQVYAASWIVPLGFLIGLALGWWRRRRKVRLPQAGQSEVSLAEAP